MLILSLVLQALQNSPEDEVRQVILQLGADSIVERDQAQGRLSELHFSWVPTLRKELDRTLDSETKTRLLGSIRRLLCKEADFLYRQGRLEQAYLKYAEADGASAPKQHVRERIEQSKQLILDLVPADPQPGGQARFDDEATARRIQDRSGRWALPALVEIAEERCAQGLSFLIFLRVLKKLQADVVPAFCSAMKSKQRQLRLETIALSPIWVGSDKLAIDTLTTIWKDSAEDPGIRRAAEDALKQMGVVRDPKEEADSLYRHGMVRRAFVKYAEAEGASEPEKHVRERIAECKKFVLGIVRADTAPRAEVPSDDVRRIQKHGGRWALPALVEAAEERCAQGSGVGPLLSILAKLPDAVPVLCSATKSAQRSVRLEAITLITGSGRGDPLAKDILMSIWKDPAEEPAIATAAQRALQEMGHLPRNPTK